MLMATGRECTTSPWNDGRRSVVFQIQLLVVDVAADLPR